MRVILKWYVFNVNGFLKHVRKVGKIKSLGMKSDLLNESLTNKICIYLKDGLWLYFRRISSIIPINYYHLLVCNEIVRFLFDERLQKNRKNT